MVNGDGTLTIPCFCRGNNGACEHCAGSGTVRVPACRRCGGTGRTGGACQDCRGAGWRELDRPVALPQ